MRISSRITTRTTGNPKGTYTFSKADRLCSNIQISRLFESGWRLDAYPLRIIFKESGEVDFPARMAISVPKRLYRNAVDRNLLKRRIREAYRLQKPGLYERLGAAAGINMVIQYRGKQLQDFKSIQEALCTGLERMLNKLEV